MSISEINLDLARARHRAVMQTGREPVVTLYLGVKEKRELLESMHRELILFRQVPEPHSLIGNLNGVNVVPVAMPSYYRVETEIQWGS